LHDTIPDDAIALSEIEWSDMIDSLAHGAEIIITDAGTLSLQMPAPDAEPDTPPPELPT